jgi:hypothetical protein
MRPATALIGLMILFAAITSCKKQAGPGGTSSIRGEILVRQYDLSFSSFDEEYPGADEEVYIIYGDDISYSERIRASYDGAFQFPYLRPGSYEVYVYSEDSAAIVGPPANPNAPRKAVLVDVEITKQHQDVDVGTIVILKND